MPTNQKKTPTEKSIFSKIMDGELPATIHYEDDDFIVIKDINPRAPVHVLIITKEPYPTLEAVDIENTALHADILVLARKMAAELGIADNYSLALNVGLDVQEVHHIHLHLMGGWEHPKPE